MTRKELTAWEAASDEVGLEYLASDEFAAKVKEAEQEVVADYWYSDDFYAEMVKKRKGLIDDYMTSVACREAVEARLSQDG